MAEVKEKVEDNKQAQLKTEEVKSDKAPAQKARKKKVKRSVPRVYIHVAASFNNTIITVTDPAGGRLNQLQCRRSRFPWQQERYGLCGTNRLREGHNRSQTTVRCIPSRGFHKGGRFRT